MKHKFKIVRPSKYEPYIMVRCALCSGVYFWVREYVCELVTGRTSLMPGEGTDFQSNTCPGPHENRRF